MKINLFISYAHADKGHLPELLTYLNETTCPQIKIWVDKNIEPGQEWNEEIINNLQNAEIVLLLISQNFLMSTYIRNNELNKALERHKEGKCKVIPIFLRYCNLNDNPEITRIQGYPSKDTPLAELGVEKDRHLAKIQELINGIADNLITKKQIELSASGNANTDKAGKAKEIERLRSQKNIFLSLPFSDEGNEIRKNFIISVEGKIKYDTPKWPFEITPGILAARDIHNKPAEEKEKIIPALINEFIYSILIIGSAEDLLHPLFKTQFELIKKANSNAALNHTILWFLNSSVKDELDKLDEKLRIELRMLPSIVGTDARSVFKLIEEFDASREKKINELSVAFSPVKKVYMFYDYDKDNESDLRILLRKKIQEDKKFAVRDLSYETIENEKKEIEECSGAVIFYGSGSDSVWYKMRERIILKAKNIQCGAVYVDGAAEPDIEKKIDRDVSITEILPIRGQKELESGVNEFKSKLQRD